MVIGLTEATTLIDKAREHLALTGTGGRWYGAIREDGDLYIAGAHTHGYGHTACHSDLRAPLSVPCPIIFSNWIAIQNGPRQLTPKNLRAVQWLLDESPWGRILDARKFNPSDEDTFKNGYIIGDITKDNTSVVFGFCIASRLLTERAATSLPLWHKLVLEGVDPNVAYIMLCKAGPDRANIDNWHGPCFNIGQVGEEYILNFLRAKQVANPTSGCGAPTSNGIWGNSVRRDTYQEFLEKTYEKFITERKADNPFAGAQTVKGLYPASDWILIEQERLFGLL